MKRWRGSGQLATGVRSSGYTVTEVMIVLAVSTALFVVVAATFQGRQARMEFTQAVRNFESKLQVIASEVANGVYQPSNCSAGSSGVPNLNATTNDGSCIFLGKAIKPDDGNPSSQIVTLIGRRMTAAATPRDVETLAEAQARTSLQVETYTHSYGLKVTRILSLENTNTTIRAIGFISPLSGGVSSTNVRGDNRQADLYGLTESNFQTPVSANSSFVALPDGVVICLVGQNRQYAEIRVGVANSQTMIFSEIDTRPDLVRGCPDAS